MTPAHLLTSPAPARVRGGLLALVLLAALPAVGGVSERLAPLFPTAVSAMPAEGALADVPLAFVPNRGQAGGDVLYSARAGGFAVELAQDEARLGELLDLRFIGANASAAVVGRAAAPGTVSYLIGDDPAGWHTGLPTFGAVVYRDLWPGIDMTFRGAAGALKYEFLVHPGASPDTIALAYAGAEGLSLDASGNLRIATPLGPVADTRPTAYQTIAGERVAVGARYALMGSSGYGFEVDAYASRHPLILDPGIEYDTLLDGAGADRGAAITLDAAGNAYVTGYTSSSDFPTTPGAFGSAPLYGHNGDAFVAKLDPTGSVVYCTYLGGATGSDVPSGIGIDAVGNAFVTGVTGSADFPTTIGAFDPLRNGSDAFVTKLNPTGSDLVYSTYLGGTNGTSDDESGAGIAVDAAGNAYVTGYTGSQDFPTTPDAFDTTLNGSNDAFVTKLDPTGSELVYSTYLGGSSIQVAFKEGGAGIAVDGAGSAYVVGLSQSSDFPSTAGAFDPNFVGGAGEPFVTKLDPAGEHLVYSTSIGRGFADAIDVAVDASGSAYVMGSTGENDFPTTPGAFDTTFNGYVDPFVTKLDPEGAALVYSTYVGGNEVEYGQDVAVDPFGNAYLVGWTYSTDFPITTGTPTTRDGTADGFVTKLDAAGASLGYSKYLDPIEHEFAYGVAADASGSAYMTGAEFGPRSTRVFVTKFSTPNQPPTARLTVSCAGRDCAFDGSGSSDPDGQITGHTWSFGDGTGPGAGPSVQHRFPEGSASYAVTLTVTDDRGATDTEPVTVTCVRPKKKKPTTCI